MKLSFARKVVCDGYDTPHTEMVLTLTSGTQIRIDEIGVVAEHRDGTISEIAFDDDDLDEIERGLKWFVLGMLLPGCVLGGALGAVIGWLT